MNEKTKSLDDTGCDMSSIVKRNAIMESDKNEPIIITDPKGIIVAERKKLNNNNTLVLGRSGTGKATSCIVPKGENLRDIENFLIKKGYQIRVLNLKNLSESDCFNPLPNKVSAQNEKFKK